MFLGAAVPAVADPGDPTDTPATEAPASDAPAETPQAPETPEAPATDPPPVPGQPVYYLSMGDSLSTGYQPGMGDTDTGYPDQLYATLKERTPGLQLVKIGCRGETTASFIKGGKCSYPTGSQLNEALRFLNEHPGQIRYVTIDIGGNDVNSCIKNNSPDVMCLIRNVSALAGNLWTIVSKVRRAGGAGPSYSGMTYYDPLLAAWLTGKSGQRQAKISVPLIESVNGLAWTIYGLANFRIADVSRAFETRNFTIQNGRPVNVSRICTWTHMCARRDIHPTTDGYTRIAQTFAATLT
ncbi:SGNH/GDSL hydrolase family protein [Actinocorallia longicatena]|uniref:SGNH hydrolase-type esterase domain-containing protein n=1 Tax=Actinocorallia longicatena TaxID=111803 RepID=A0ABP6QAV0_9ACTN